MIFLSFREGVDHLYVCVPGNNIKCISYCWSKLIVIANKKKKKNSSREVELLRNFSIIRSHFCGASFTSLKAARSRKQGWSKTKQTNKQTKRKTVVKSLWTSEWSIGYYFLNKTDLIIQLTNIGFRSQLYNLLVKEPWPKFFNHTRLRILIYKMKMKLPSVSSGS